MIWAWNTPPVETTSLEEIPDRFVEIIKAPDEPEPPEVPEQEVIENPDAKPVETEEKKPDEPKPEKKPETKKEKEAAEAAQKAKKREDVMKKSKLLAALIGTRGDTTNSGTVEDLFADSDASIGSIQDALQTAGGVEVATADNLGVKKAAPDPERTRRSVTSPKAAVVQRMWVQGPPRR